MRISAFLFLLALGPFAALAAEPVSIETLLAKVRAEYPGDVLKVEREDDHGRALYEVKLLTAEGRVMKLIYDATTLDLLKAKGPRGEHRGKDN